MRDSYKDEDGNLIEKVRYHIIGYIPILDGVYMNEELRYIEMKDNICISYNHSRWMD